MNIHITLKQAQVLIGLMAGRTPAAVAKELGVTRNAVNHKTLELFEKFGVQNREALLTQAHRSRSVVDLVPSGVDVIWPGKTGAVRI